MVQGTISDTILCALSDEISDRIKETSFELKISVENPVCGQLIKSVIATNLSQTLPIRDVFYSGLGYNSILLLSNC